MPHQLHPLPGSRQTLPCLPWPAWVGPRLLPVPAASSAQGRVPHAAGCRSGMSLAPPPSPRSACHLSIWATAWVPPSLLLQAVGRATDPQSWEPGEGAHWQNPREKEQTIRSLPPPPPAVPSSPDRPLGRVTALQALSSYPQTSVCKHSLPSMQTQPALRATHTQPCTQSHPLPACHTQRPNTTRHSKPPPHTGFHAVSVKYTQWETPCACPVTQTCTASLGVYNCPRHNQASSILGVLVLGGRSLSPPCVCSSKTLPWTSLILVLSVCWSYDKPIWGGCHPNSLALLQSGPLGRQAKVRTSPRDSLLPQPSGDTPPPASESRHRQLKRPHCSLQCLPCTFLIWCW